MGRTLTHLPTKKATITPSEGRPFVRKQHYNPDKKEGDPDQPNTRTEADKRRLNPAIKEQLRKYKETLPEEEIEPVAVPPINLEMSIAEALTPKTPGLSIGEQLIKNRLPQEITAQNKMHVVTGKRNMNEVHAFTHEGQNYYWKTKQGELKNRPEGDLSPPRDTITGNLYNREIGTYELSKLLGVEGMVPPTGKFSYQMEFGLNGNQEGSAQLSVHDFATKILGYRRVGSIPQERNKVNMRNLFENTENATDLVAFQIISGQTDGHAGNLQLAEAGKNRYHAMVSDNGFALPEHAGDMIHPDWHNNFDMWRNYFSSNAKNAPLSKSFMEGILGFHSDAFDQVCREQGLPESVSKGVKDRVALFKNKIKEKYKLAAEKAKTMKFSIKSEYEAFMKENLTFTGHDIEAIFRETFMDNNRSKTETKYGPDVLGNWQSPNDWTKELKWVLEGDQDED